jgi:anaerobic magnesium-protoporphyrin IX monomethyl ester cyclase
LLKGRVRQLYDMGLRSIYTGVESLASSALHAYSKGHTVEGVLDVFRELNDLNVRTTISYILGYETDTVESILESIDVLKTEVKPFCTAFLVMTPHTNSRIEHLEGAIFDHNPAHYDTRNLVWKHPNLSPEDIRELLWVAHRETVNPKNRINRRLVARLGELEKSDGPLYSCRVSDIYRARRERHACPSDTSGVRMT